jgi:o-succinylbenzoate synthase
MQPLKRAYELSLGSHKFLKGVICRATSETEKCGFAETVPLAGYSWETEEYIWQNVRHVAMALEAGDESCFFKTPFAASAIMTAVEHLLVFPGDSIDKIPPLVGVVGIGKEKLKVLEDVLSLVEKGYRTIKVKVGMAGIEEDVRIIKEILSLLPGEGKLRVDANQSYSVQDARIFAEKVPLDQIEYLEQPFLKDDWEKLLEVKNLPFSIMLDESIWTEEDLYRAKEWRVEWVKLKLLKQGGPERSSKMIQKAKELGLRVIWGNGFQGEIGCWHEIRIAHRNELSMDLECNGYLKLERSLLERNFELRGCLKISDEKLRSVTHETKEVVVHKQPFLKRLFKEVST